VRTNVKRAVGTLAIACIAGVAGGCSSSGSTASSTPLSGSSGGTQGTSSEYLTLAAPVDSAQATFKASRTTAELRLTAGPFAAALQKWRGELAALKWPASAQSAISVLESDIVPFVPGLTDLSSGSIGYDSFVATYGRLGTALSLAAAAARRALGLPPI
jgi:hypothetical protein